MPIILNVPFAEKDSAKKAGAYWNPQIKKWYIPDKITELHPFRKWRPSSNLFVKSPLLFALHQQQCWKCEKTTPLFSLAADSLLYFAGVEEGETEDDDVEIWEKTDFTFVYSLETIPEPFCSLIKQHFPYFHLGHSKTTNITSWVNHCTHCGILQGDHFVHQEFAAGFILLKPAEAQKVTLIEFPIDFDLDLIGTCNNIIYLDSSPLELVGNNAKRLSLEKYLQTK